MIQAPLLYGVLYRVGTKTIFLPFATMNTFAKGTKVFCKILSLFVQYCIIKTFALLKLGKTVGESEFPWSFCKTFEKSLFFVTKFL
jgi:hypothetical protein